MIIQIWARYRLSNKFQLRVGLGTGLHKTLPENTCITGKVIYRQEVSSTVCVNYNIKLSMAIEFFSIFSI